MSFKRFVSLFVLLLLPFYTIAQQTTLVSVDTVTRDSFEQTISVVGRLVAKQQGAVATRISGNVVEINVEVGDQVKQGQIMARLDVSILMLKKQQVKVQIEEANARLVTTKAKARLAKQEVKRLSQLTDSTAVSQATVEKAQQQANIALAQVTEAQASIKRFQVALQLAELEVGYTNIIAPYDATITQKHTEVGSYLQIGQPLFQLILGEHLEIDANVASNSIDRLDKDNVVLAILDSGETYQARIRAVVPIENMRTRARQVRFEFLPGQKIASLVSGQTLTIRIPIAKAQRLLSVNKDGITQTPKGKIAFIVVDGKAQPRVVEVGEAVNERLTVISGLNAGDQVIIRGNERLSPGQTVQIAR